MSRRVIVVASAVLMLLGACRQSTQAADAGMNPCGAVGQECCYFHNNSCNPGLMCVGGLVCVPPDDEMDAGSDDAGTDAGPPDAGGSPDAGSGVDAGVADAGTTIDAGQLPCGCDPSSGCFSCADAGNVICAETTCVSPHYLVNGDGTVTDTVTGLLWQQAVSSNPCPADDGGYPSGCRWSDAQKYCASLNLGSDAGTWRLPAMPELFSLVEPWSTPTIDSSAFPGTPQQPFWTSTAAFMNADAFVVYFNSGTTASFDPGFAFQVRCVQ
jgi:hypothetical protein